MAQKPYVVAQVGMGIARFAVMSDGRRLPWDAITSGGYFYRDPDTGVQYDPSKAPRMSRKQAEAAVIKASAGKPLPYTPTMGDNPLNPPPPGGTFWDNVTPTVPKQHSASETRATQTFLKNKGYNLSVDGVWGPQTQSAALNWRNARDPNAWNQGGNANRTVVKTTTAPTPTRAAPTAPAPKNTAPTAPAAAAAAQDPYTALVNQLLGGVGAPPAYQNIPLSLANQGYQPVDISQVPDFQGLDINQLMGLAGASDAAQLQVLQNQLAALGPTAAQHQADISNWFGQLQGAIGTAQGNAGKAQKQAVGHIKNATQGILSSLGGEANPGAGMVGAEGASQAGYASQLGQIQSNFLSSMTPIISLAQSGAAQAEAARMSQQQAELQNQMILAQGQQKADLFNQMMAVAQYNQQGQQQEFSNRMSLQQYNAQLAANRLASILGIRQTNQQGQQQYWSNLLARAGLGMQAGQFGLQAADTQSTIASRAASDANAAQQTANQTAQVQFGISQQLRDNQIKAQQARIQTNQAAQNAQKAGWLAGVNQGLFSPAGVVPQGGVQAAVSAIRASAAGLPPQVRKQVIRANLLALKNAKGQPLLTLSMIQSWGY